MSVKNEKRFFLSISGIVFVLFTFLDVFFYISQNYPLKIAVLVSISRFFLYIPISVLIAMYFTVLKNSTFISKKAGTAGILSGIFAGFFAFAGCPACLFGLLVILSSLGLLGSGIFFWFMKINNYAGLLFILTVVAMLLGIHLIADSNCRIKN